MTLSLSQASAVYAKWRPWIDKYAGGIPPGFVAAVMTMESGGRPEATGDPNLGEVGLLQVAKNTPSEFGLPADSRYDNENNIFIGTIDIAQRAVRAYLAAPDLIVLGTADFWKMGRLSAAVGAAGARNLIAAARPLQRGNAFAGILAWSRRTGAIGLSVAQPASKVAARIELVEQSWNIGQALTPGRVGHPTKVNPPAKLGTYSLPAGMAGYFKPPMNKQILAVALLAAVGVGVYYVSKNY